MIREFARAVAALRDMMRQRGNSDALKPAMRYDRA